MTADLAIDTAVERREARGEYTASLSEAWSFRAPSGGVLMTVALRAMQAEVGDAAFPLVSANAIFCSPIPAGPLAIRVEVLRRGNAAVQVRGALSALGAADPGLEVSATFARDREGPELPGEAGLDLPGHAECSPRLRQGRDRDRSIPAFFRNFELRAATPPAWWEPGGSAEGQRIAYWMRYLAPQRLADGSVDPLAIPPIADTMPPSVAQRLGPGATPFDAPSLDLTVHFLAPARGEWLLVDTRAHHARAGYASAEARIRDEGGRLVAFATQTMILRARRR